MQTATAPTPKNGSVHHPKKRPVIVDQIAYHVYITYDYDRFKIMADNRNINLLHVRRLVESFKNKYLVCPIICNEYFEVIDGQHRREAAKETGEPLYYIMIEGYGIEEVQILNVNQKNWTKMDHLHSYCAEGVKPYLEFKKFMDDFPELSFQACERILTGLSSGSATKRQDGKSVAMKDFEQGKLFIPDLNKSYSVARRIMDFKPHYPGFYKGIFATVMLSLLKSKNYNHKEMLHKLSVCPIKMQDCLNVEEYKKLIEDIYNHKRLRENKVSFRYD